MFPDTLVVPLDGSELAARALPVARAFVRQTGGRLLLMTTRWDDDVRTARDYLDEISAANQDVEVSTTLIVDRPAGSAIQLVATESPGRVVCMTTHGRGRMRWALLGSVAEEVVRESSDPVMLLGRHCRTDWPNNFRKMVVCVDGTNGASALQPTAVEWAKTLGLDVHVATVIHPLDATESDTVLDAIVGPMEAQGLHPHECVLRDRYPAGAIADFAESVDADLVAMSSHARAGTARVALGSVTMGVVGMARCPVLVTRTA
jgi:nucleotide-binding universal stress UspA family protein